MIFFSYLSLRTFQWGKCDDDVKWTRFNSDTFETNFKFASLPKIDSSYVQPRSTQFQ